MFAPVFFFFNFANIWTLKNSDKSTVRVENGDSNAIVPIYLTLHVANGHKHHVSAFYHQITPTRVGSGLGTRERIGRSYPCFGDGMFLDCYLAGRIESSFLFFFV
jgi:hypothetical protein